LFYGVEIENNKKHILTDLMITYPPREILYDKSYDISQINDVICNFIPFNDDLEQNIQLPVNIAKKIEGKETLKENVFHILSYVEGIHQVNITYIEGIELINPQFYFFLESSTIKNLEILKNSQGYIKNSFLETMRHTITSMGSRLFRTTIVKPLKKKELIDERLSFVELLLKEDNKNIVKKIITKLYKINDIERLSSKLISNTIIPDDILSLKDSILEVKEIQKLLLQIK